MKSRQHLPVTTIRSCRPTKKTFTTTVSDSITAVRSFLQMIKNICQYVLYFLLICYSRVALPFWFKYRPNDRSYLGKTQKSCDSYLKAQLFWRQTPTHINFTEMIPEWCLNKFLSWQQSNTCCDPVYYCCCCCCFWRGGGLGGWSRLCCNWQSFSGSSCMHTLHHHPGSGSDCNHETSSRQLKDFIFLQTWPCRACMLSSGWATGSLSHKYDTSALR